MFETLRMQFTKLENGGPRRYSLLAVNTPAEQHNRATANLGCSCVC